MTVRVSRPRPREARPKCPPVEFQRATLKNAEGTSTRFLKRSGENHAPNFSVVFFGERMYIKRDVHLHPVASERDLVSTATRGRSLTPRLLRQRVHKPNGGRCVRALVVLCYGRARCGFAFYVAERKNQSSTRRWSAPLDERPGETTTANERRGALENPDISHARLHPVLQSQLHHRR